MCKDQSLFIILGIKIGKVIVVLEKSKKCNVVRILKQDLSGIQFNDHIVSECLMYKITNISYFKSLCVTRP